ncbi:MAG: sigma-70 family RNA polymerase sigma factor [Vicinamibacteraceae bacterium]
MTDSRNTTDRLGALMQAAQSGDAEAYVRLLQEVTPRIRHIVHRRRQGRSDEECEDLVQDVLLSVHAVRATYNPQRSFMPWLLAIVRNRLADGARRYARRAAHEVSIENGAVTMSHLAANSSGETYRDPEALAQAIETLPHGQRRAIELLKIRGLSLKEAAAASGTSIGALKVATHRAMDTLRKILTGVQ